jgi:hypothetical protein
MNISLDETLKSAFGLFKVPFEPVSNIFYIPNKANAKYIIEFDYMTSPPLTVVSENNKIIFRGNPTAVFIRVSYLWKKFHKGESDE